MSETINTTPTESYQDSHFTAEQKKVLEGTIRVFNKKGLKFTMSELATELKMSKKTLYKIFDDKDALFFAMVDYLFDGIKESKAQVLNDPTLSTIQKIHKILGVMPDSYRDVDFRQLYMLRDKYPEVYKQVETRLETGWDETIFLLKKGMDEGVVKKTPTFLIKMMLEASIEQFFQRNLLQENDMTYQEALSEVVNIIIYGISE